MPESARRRERLNRLLGSEWPSVTLMRDAGGKSSPPWVWWLEDDGYDHDKYEVAEYIPAAALPSLRAALYEEFKEAVLSDEAVEAGLEAGWGVPRCSASTRERESQRNSVLAALDSLHPERGEGQ